MNAKLVFLTASLLFSLDAAACVSNMDCRHGSRCVKEDGSMEGVCAGGSHPGNANDKQPMRDALDQEGKYGETCRFDAECGHSDACYVEVGPEGVCMPRQ